MAAVSTGDRSFRRSSMRTSNRSVIWVIAAATVAAGTLLATTTTSEAQRSAVKGDHIGKPMFEEQPSASGVVSRNAITIPSWTSSFTDPSNGETYHYTMVGTAPTAGNVTTAIPTVIIPMNFNFRSTGVS